jgi:hypothetical protein
MVEFDTTTTTTTPDRECPHCKRSIRSDANVCPHCRKQSAAWTFHEGRWWASVAGVWYWLDETTRTWHPVQAASRRRARRRFLKVLGIAAVVMAAVTILGMFALLVWAIALGEEQRHEWRDKVVAAHLRARVGTPQSVIRQRLGEPAFVEPISVRGRTVRCWIYLVDDARAEASDIPFRFCFVNGQRVESPDPLEPNDNIYFVKPRGLFGQKGVPPVTRPGQPSVSLRGRLDWPQSENDPNLFYDGSDVYRLYLPRNRTLRVRVIPTADVDVEVWDASTASVYLDGAARQRHLIVGSYEDGRHAEEVTVSRRRSAGSFVYVEVYLLDSGPNDAEYNLTVTPTT